MARAAPFVSLNGQYHLSESIFGVKIASASRAMLTLHCLLDKHVDTTAQLCELCSAARLPPHSSALPDFDWRSYFARERREGRNDCTGTEVVNPPIGDASNPSGQLPALHTHRTGGISLHLQRPPTRPSTFLACAAPELSSLNLGSDGVRCRGWRAGGKAVAARQRQSAKQSSQLICTLPFSVVGSAAPRPPSRRDCIRPVHS